MKLHAKQGSLDVGVSDGKTLTILEPQPGAEYICENTDIEVTEYREGVTTVKAVVEVRRTYKDGVPLDLYAVEL